MSPSVWFDLRTWADPSFVYRTTVGLTKIRPTLTLLTGLLTTWRCCFVEEWREMFRMLLLDLTELLHLNIEGQETVMRSRASPFSTLGYSVYHLFHLWTGFFMGTEEGKVPVYEAIFN